MPRPLRVEYEGAIYHVVNRGDRRENIFHDDKDRELFLATLGAACGKAGWEIHAYCLMSNHFHLVVETPQPTLVAGMKWLLGTYTQRFNARHRFHGHLFAGRYKALLVDGAAGPYLRAVCDYVHLNPARAQILEPTETLERYPWSSYPGYVGRASTPGWLRKDRLLGEHGIRSDNAQGRRDFSRRMEARRAEPEDDMYADIRREWKLGAEDFLDRLKDRLERVSRESHLAIQVRETMAVKARRLIDEALRAEGLEAADLPVLPKAHPMKLRIARKLRQETTWTLKEVAAALHAGSWRTLANGLVKMKD